MLASVDRSTALGLLSVEHNAVRALIDELSDEEMTRPDTIEYGLYPDQKLSFKDLLAHLIVYEAYTVAAIQDWHAGERHWACDAMQSAQGSLEIHYGGIADRAEMSLQAVLEEWDTTQRALTEAIANLSDDGWRQPAPYSIKEPTDLGGMIEGILVVPPRPMYRHLPVHIPDPEQFIEQLRRE